MNYCIDNGYFGPKGKLPTECHPLISIVGNITNFAKQLGLYLYKEIMRCHGRIDMITISDRMKSQVLLPNKHKLTSLTVQYGHTVCLCKNVGIVCPYL